MIRAKTIVLLLAGASLTLTTACTDPGNPGGGQPGDKTQQGVLIGGLLGAVAGAMLASIGLPGLNGFVGGYRSPLHGERQPHNACVQ